MSGEAVVVWGTQKTLEAAGIAIPNGSVVQADDATYDQAADGANFPDAQLVLTCAFGTAPLENGALSVYARELAVDGTASTDVPETTRPGRFIGSFLANNVTTSQTLVLMAQDVPARADYYIHNNGTGQSVATGWSLKIKPRTIKVA